MALLTLIVDLLEELDVLGHNLRVLLLVNILVLLEHGPQVVNVVLEVLSLLRVLLVKVSVSTFLLHLLLHVLFVQADHSSLQFLEIGDVVQYLKNIILEGFLVALLLVEVLTQLLYFVGEAFLTHAQVINNQSQVLVDSVEEFELLTHLVGLLVELLDFELSWANVSLELFDLIIEHKLELLKLLSLLPEVIDSLVLVFNGGCSLLKLTFLRLDGLLQVVSHLVESIKI